MKLTSIVTSEFTPDFKDKNIDTEKAKTYNTPFISLKRPDFKARFHPMWAESAVLLSWWIPWRYLYDFNKTEKAALSASRRQEKLTLQTKIKLDDKADDYMHITFKVTDFKVL